MNEPSLLHYITPWIIAMPFPYNYEILSEDLKHNHGDKYMIINISEIEYNNEQ